MKKIGILTQPLINNYGGILQNYALQYTLRHLGYECETINFAHTGLKIKKIRLILSILKRVTKRIFGKRQEFLNPIKEDREIFKIHPEQERFISSYIKKIDIYSTLTKEFDNNNKYDIYIVGSDQIWRPKYSPNIRNYFLDFVDDRKKKIAYAASFGTDQWEYTPELTLYAKTFLKKFDAISVREKSGVTLCSQYLDCNSIHVLDPTMLLKAENYNLLIRDNEKSKYPYIAAYILDKSKITKYITQEMSNELSIAVKGIGEKNEGKLESIEDWLKDIRDADFIITDSFHGTVFSIIYHKSFFTLVNESRGSSRIHSLLSLFGLENRIIKNIQDFKNIKSSEINWRYVDCRIDELRDISLQFLKEECHE